MKRTNKRAIIALDLVSLDTPGLVAFSGSVQKGLGNNQYIQAADLAKFSVQLPDLATATNALHDTHTSRGTSSSTSATKQERDQANTVMDMLTDLAGSVESFANRKAAGDYALAEAIIASTGFKVKKQRAPKTPKSFDIDSLVKGTAEVTLPKGPEGSVELVIYSTDGGKTWSFPTIVRGRAYVITGLKSGTEVLAKHATNLPPKRGTKLTVAAGSEEPVWSDVVTCIVK